MNTYDVGDRIRLTAAFTSGGVAADPTTVTVRVKDPSGNTASYVYGTDLEVVKDGTGNYHMDVTIDEAGIWGFRWASTGVVVTAEEKSFRIRPQAVV